MVKKIQTLLSIIQKSSSIYIDTNVFIYYFENNPDYNHICERIFDTIEENNIKIIISSILLTEIFVYPYKSKNNSTIQKWLDYFKFSPNIYIKDLCPKIAVDAAYLRSKYSLKTPDTIHLSTAIHQKADYFLCNDKPLKKVDEISLIYLSEYKL